MILHTYSFRGALPPIKIFGRMIAPSAPPLPPSLLIPTHFKTFTLTHSNTLTPTHSNTLTPTYSDSHTYTLTHALSYTLGHTHTYTL